MMTGLERVLTSLRSHRGSNGICGACLRLLPGLTGASLVVMTGSAAKAPVCATDEVCGRLEDLQFTLGEGPSVDAFRSGGPVLIADLAADEQVRRWPGFSREALAAGAQALFVFPLQVGAMRVGVLELYRDKPGGLSQREMTDAMLVSHATTLVLLDGSVERVWMSGDGVIPYRAEVHQATGMVMAQLTVSLEEAFVRLRARAYAEGRTVDAVARDVVERVIRFEEGPVV